MSEHQAPDPAVLPRVNFQPGIPQTDPAHVCHSDSRERAKMQTHKSKEPRIDIEPRVMLRYCPRRLTASGHDGASSNGRTRVFGTRYPGSNPGAPAIPRISGPMTGLTCWSQAGKKAE